MDTVPKGSECSTGSAYLPPVTTGDVARERGNDAALPGVTKVPGRYAAFPATFTVLLLSFVGAD